MQNNNSDSHCYCKVQKHHIFKFDFTDHTGYSSGSVPRSRPSHNGNLSADLPQVSPLFFLPLSLSEQWRRQGGGRPPPPLWFFFFFFACQVSGQSWPWWYYPYSIMKIYVEYFLKSEKIVSECSPPPPPLSDFFRAGAKFLASRSSSESFCSP